MAKEKAKDNKEKFGSILANAKKQDNTAVEKILNVPSEDIKVEEVKEPVKEPVDEPVENKITTETAPKSKSRGKSQIVKPVKETRSAKFETSITPSLKTALAKKAKKEGVSQNEVINQLIKAYVNDKFIILEDDEH